MDPSVTPSVACMSTSRLAYDDPATPAEMTGDCLAVGRRLDLPRQRPVAPVAATLWTEAVRGTHRAPWVSEGLATRAADLELHLD